jgi:GNAT superfamily N-acetyltransferase
MRREQLADASELSIRFATEADTGIIAQLIRELAEFEELIGSVSMTADDLKRNLFGERRFGEVLIATRDTEPVGFALFFHNFSTFLGKPGIYLEDIYVRPNCRSLGIGRKILEVVAEIALERGCGRFEWAVLNWNKRAIQFYEELGAKSLSEWTTYRLDGSNLKRLAGIKELDKASPAPPHLPAD